MTQKTIQRCIAWKKVEIRTVQSDLPECPFYSSLPFLLQDSINHHLLKEAPLLCALTTIKQTLSWPLPHFVSYISLTISPDFQLPNRSFLGTNPYFSTSPNGTKWALVPISVENGRYPKPRSNSPGCSLLSTWVFCTLHHYIAQVRIWLRLLLPQLAMFQQLPLGFH